MPVPDFFKSMLTRPAADPCSYEKTILEPFSSIFVDIRLDTLTFIIGAKKLTGGWETSAPAMFGLKN